MSGQSASTKPQLDPNFIDGSSLKYLIPYATDFVPENISKDSDVPVEKFFDSIPQRESLFYDESVTVVFALKTPYLEGDSLRDALKHIKITLEAQIVDGTASDRDSPLASEVIYTGTVDGSQDPATIIHGPPDGDVDGPETSSRYAYAVWQKPVFLSRPRNRLQSPSAVFVATASSRPPAGSLSDEPQDAYLPSGMTSSLNLLESLGGDPELDGIKPRLSALRVSRVAPLTHQADELMRSIKSSSSISLRIYPVVHSRIRFTHPNSAPPTPVVIAMLEIDFTPFFDCEISLDTVALTIPEATVDNLTDQVGLSLPLSCVSHDHLTFIYRIAPLEKDATSPTLTQDLDIAISATVLVASHMKPQLRMAWTATVDFTVPVNPGYGSTMQPFQRAHRPSRLSISSDSTVSLTAPSVSRPDALPSLEASTTQTEAAVRELGITVTFTAPSPAHKIFVGDEFAWSIFVVNQPPTQAAAPRKFAMVVIPRRRRNESRVTRPPSVHRTPDGPHGHLELPSDRDVAEAILDDNVVHTMQSSSVVDNAELVCLSADVRVGPLVPGSCHMAELKFLALKEGVIGVDAVRIIDLANNEHVDIRQLPTVTVHRKPETP